MDLIAGNIQPTAIEKAATDAGVNLDDRTKLIVDLGSSSSSLSVTLLSIREGLTYIFASSHSNNTGGDQIDKFIKFLATDFTKKTKQKTLFKLTVCPSTNISDKRTEAKLRLAIEHTKRTIGASPSPGAATCSVESFVDYTGSINRKRFDMVVNALAVTSALSALLADAGVDAHNIDEIVYVGGTSRRLYLFKVQGGNRNTLFMWDGCGRGHW